MADVYIVVDIKVAGFDLQCVLISSCSNFISLATIIIAYSYQYDLWRLIKSINGSAKGLSTPQEYVICIYCGRALLYIFQG